MDKELDKGFRIVALLRKKIQRALSQEEAHELEEWIASEPRNEKFVTEILEEALNNRIPDLLNKYDPGKGLIYIHKKIRKKAERKARIRRIWWGGAVAAASLGIFFYYQLSMQPSPSVNPAGGETVFQKVDFPAGTSRATLILGNGEQVDVSTKKDSSFQRNNLQVNLDHGTLSYKNTNPGQEVRYNTLVTPNGGEYQLTLEDGTRVWLNAASSLEFPDRFVGPERNVKVKGEAYFEVAQNAAKPFIVSSGEMQIQVLGTQFNINAYPDETAMITTLLQGSVSVNYGKGSKILKPGQEALSGAGDGLITVREANTQKTIAWTKGQFDFKGEYVPGLMRQLARWYDVDIKYEGKIPSDRITGKAPRYTSLAVMLEILKLNGIHCTVEGRTIIVKSK